ncbi:MAG: hypothetical protein JWM58_3806 [Rhizobium sp.]|nr:hypothetical protein [Rhizobium sp.]
MKGQWLGFFGGDLNGPMMIEVDERRQFQDIACYFRILDNPRVLYVRARCEIGSVASVRGPLTEQLNSKLAASENPSFIDIDFRVQEPELVVDFRLDTGERCSAMLLRSRAHLDSELPAKRMSWAGFESYVRKIEPRRYVFRGQESNKWRLRTSFHRSGRSNMLRYMVDDVSMIQQRVTNLVPEFVDINDPIRYAAFLALAQHHGYPTPLLDWTRSPFVAAFFAFRKDQTQLQAQRQKRFIRIFILDEEAWLASGDRAPDIAPRMPHVTLVYPHALGNPRLIPQQALTSITNVDDIENYITTKSHATNVTYLSVIDIPVAERNEVLKQLAFMGVTAGSLFPGLDGAFEELKAIRF